MDKITVIHGAHAVGKTHTLRQAFNIPDGQVYTHQSLYRGKVDFARRGNTLWLPEWRHRSARHGDLNQRLHDFYVETIDSHDGDFVLDSVMRFNQVVLAAGERRIQRLTLSVDPESHRSQFMGRGKCRPSSQSKDDAWLDASKRQLYMERKWTTVTAAELIEKIIAGKL